MAGWQVSRWCSGLTRKRVCGGLVGVGVQVKVKVGDDVRKGQPLLVLSAMKMETVVASPTNGKVISVPVGVGDNIAGGDLVVEVE